MEPAHDLPQLLGIWLAAAGLVVLRQSRPGAASVGLVLAYLLNLWLIHWPAAVLYALPWYENPWHSNWDAAVVAAGLRQSTYGVVAFAAGSLLLAPRFRRRQVAPASDVARTLPATDHAGAYIAIGALSYFVLLPLARSVPTLTALVAAGWGLLVAGLCLACRRAWLERRRGAFASSILVGCCLPLFTIVTAGFASYGVAMTMAFLCFVTSFYRPRWKLLAVGVVCVYAGLGLYLTYMRDRPALREVVWGGAPLAERTQALLQTVTRPEWFDPYNNEHLGYIDERLNQDYLVGAAVLYLAEGIVDSAAGETVWQAALALVPRALWPEKPVVAGSGDLVSRFTGIGFADGTAVGIGHVLEFYVNFGTAGVVAGFLILGTVLTVVDGAAGRRLAQRDWPGFVLWYLPGLSFLNVGGSLVELTSSAAAAIAVAWLANRFLRREPRTESPETARRSLAGSTAGAT